MSWLGLFTVVGIVVVAALVWLFLRTYTDDQIDALIKKHQATAKIADRADYVEGIERIPVVLSVENGVLCYENRDLDAKLDLQNVDEVEYDSELSTGKEVDKGRVLRLRSHGQTFEFVIDGNRASQWANILPPHRLNDQPQATAV